MYYCYILYSAVLDRYYTGSTTLLPDERLKNHLRDYYGKSKFTSKVNDWLLYYYIECQTKYQSQNIERHIKRMKSKAYITNLKKHLEISKKLLKLYE